MKKLDFIVIGAQKSATTSLFKYLNAHSDIYMPSAKEAPFYSQDDLYSNGWEPFAEENFKDAERSKLWGTASPQYMSDWRVPARISEHNPNVRLIAVLRNPAERAWSHYLMACRRGMENRHFDEVVKELTEEKNARKNRDLLPPDHSSGYSSDSLESHYYLAWSEYGRILSQYLEYFPKQQLKIVLMDDLQHNTSARVREILEFIGADSTRLPTNLSKVYHKGGAQKIIPDTWKKSLKQTPGVRHLWHLLPKNLKGYFNYWYEVVNVRKDKNLAISNQARLALSDFFKADLDRLQHDFSIDLPWPQYPIEKGVN